MKKLMAILFGNLCFAFSYAQTQVGGSAPISLDTRQGDVEIMSSWHSKDYVSIRLSGRWFGDGVLFINGDKCDSVGGTVEKDFLLMVLRNTAMTYVCELRTDGYVYSRTIHMTGVCKATESCGVKLDTMTGVRDVSAEGEDLRYDASWLSDGNRITMEDNGGVLVLGTCGMYDWQPTNCGEHQLRLIVLNSGGSQVGGETADFLVGHKVESVDEVSATCTQPGRAAGNRCVWCGEYVSGGESIASLGHDPKTMITAIEPTCTTEGRAAEVKCARCGETLESSHELAALGHDRKTTISAIEPTCTAAGRTAEAKCTRCGEMLETSHELVALGHSEVITKPAIEPTSSKPGMTAEIKCSRCGLLIQAATEIPAIESPSTNDVSVLYVDGVNGNDSNSGKSASMAKKTIQAAIDVATTGDEICVRPGIYAPITALDKALVIVAEQGPACTIIDGGGSSVCAILGVSYDNLAQWSTLRGFTIQHGYYGDAGAAARWAYLDGCVIKECRGRAIVYACKSYNCLVYGNTCTSYGVFMHGDAYNCTVVDGGGRCAAWDNGFYNCIVLAGIYLSYGQPECCHNCLLSTSRSKEEGNIVGDPKFVDADNGDYRLAVNSPCIDAGSDSYVMSETDLDGNARIANGRIDIGAYEYGSTSAADLGHRWSFNGDLMDSVGGRTATAVGSVTTEHGQCKLTGGKRGASYVNLGANLLPVDGRSATIEIWATQNAIQDWSRIWDVGTDEGTDSIGEMYAAWTSFSTLNAAPVCIRNVSVDKGNLAPYSLGVEYHIAAVFEPQDDGTWQVKFYKQDAKTGATSASYTISTSSSSSWSLSNQAQGSFFLGHGHHTDSCDASASYNEVRVWNRALTEAELTANVLLGPDVLPSESSGPETPTYTITFNANGGTPTPSSITRKKGESYGELPIVTRSGYVFDGWYTAASGGTRVSAETIVTADVTLYAHWSTLPGYSSQWFPGGLLDICSGARRTSEAQQLTMSPEWEGDGVKAIVSVDGEPYQEATSAGVCTWAGTRTKEYTLTHQVVDSGGAAIGEPYVVQIIWRAGDLPAIRGDENAVVTGDAEHGFVITPNVNRVKNVEVIVPQGMDAGDVLVKVPAGATTVKPNGAKMKVVNGGADITEFLNVPAAGEDGVIDLSKVTVKEEIVKETMDVEKGAEIELNAANPKLTTAPTREGLFYQLREGETLDGMKDGDSTIGNGQPWTPKITVKDGDSAFYSIGVGKGN